MDENEKINELRVWKRDLKDDMDTLSYDCDVAKSRIDLIHLKIGILRSTAKKNDIWEEGYYAECMSDLQEELQAAKETLKEAEEEFNQKFKFLKALTEEIDTVMSTQ